MSFVYRAERKFLPVLDQTGTDVGPGSYLRSEMDLRVGMKYSVAPFCSTSRRVFAGNDERRSFQTPGPGSYHQEKADAGFKEQKGFASGSNFASRTKRFDEGKWADEKTPGPGSYESSVKSISRDARKRQIQAHEKKRMRDKKQAVEYIKVFSTPSIPSNPSKRMQNTRRPSPGPGQYFEQKSGRKMKNKSSMFQSKTGRNIFGRKLPEKIPGPGTYHTQDMEDLKRQRGEVLEESDPFQHTSSFASTTKRFNNFLVGSKETKKERPGPGKYLSINHASSFSKMKRKPEKYQNFGSTCLRFGKHKHHTPGPGHFFQDNRSYFSRSSTKLGDSGGHLSHHPNQQLYRRSFHPPFLSSQKRFQPTGKERESKKISERQVQQHIMETKIADEKKSLKQRDMSKAKRSGHVPPFMSTEKRFLKSRKDEEFPGVGKYHISADIGRSKSFARAPNQMKAKKKRRTAMAFGKLGRTGRPGRPMSTKKRKPTAPGPGYYNNDLRQISTFGRMKNATRFRTDRRFRDSSKKDIPGPGTYDNHTSTFDRKLYRPVMKKASSNIQSANRRKNVAREIKKRLNNRPGPGAYDLMDQWDKKTYNVSIM